MENEIKMQNVGKTSQAKKDTDNVYQLGSYAPI
jgi:hypothetical protein